MKLSSLALSALLAVTPLAATAAPWTLDKSHTHIDFTVNHLGFSETRGTFSDFDAVIDFDPDNVEAASVSFTIKAASINTFWDARDEHVRGKDFLNVEEHEDITFTSTSITKTGDTTADVTGDLTIIGVTQPITLKAVLNNLGPNPFAPEVTVAGFNLSGEIDRTAFGIGFGAPAIGAVLPLTISLEMSPAK